MADSVSRAAAEPTDPSLPWSARLLLRAPVPPLVAGIALSCALIALLAAIELAAGDAGPFLRGEDPRKGEEYRFSAVFALLAGYLPAATAYAVAGGRRTLAALGPALRAGAAGAPASAAARIGCYERRALIRSGLVGVAASLLVPVVVDLSLSVYDLRGASTAAAGHRVLIVGLGWLLGRFVHVTLADSLRLAALGREGVRVDLLDLSPLAPFARHGLRSALLALGFFAIVALLLPDWRARPGLPWVLGTGLAVAVAFAAAALVIPVRGVHDAIRAAKRAEGAWCRSEIAKRREALASGDFTGSAPLDELASYLALVEGVRAWPFDVPTLARFGLYLGLPVGSWLGGALVERFVNSLLG
jgi:hypothetical protein